MRKSVIYNGWSFLILIIISLNLPGCTPEPVETDLLLPVDFSNVPENMVLTAFHTDKIEIRIQATPKLIEEIKSDNTRYSVDLYTDLAFDPAGDTVSIEPGEYLIPVVKKRIPLRPGIRIKTTNPSYLSVTLDKKIKKRFKVIVPYTGRPAKGHQALPATTEPDSVELTGPFSKIQSIKELKTKPIDLSDTKKSFKKKIPLDLEIPSIISKPGQLVTVSVPIRQIMMEKTLIDIPIQVKNTQLPVQIKPPVISIKIKGPFQSLADDKILNRIESFMDLKNLKPGVYARHAYIDVPVGLMMTDASPQVFTVKID